MRNFIIKILSLCLIISTALFIGTGCVEKSITDEQGLKYKLNKDRESYTLIDGTSSNNVEIEIPSFINDKPVTHIGDDAFYDCDNLISIVVPDTVISIGAAVFYDCDNLISVTLSDSLISIGEKAFWGCRNKAATIPTLAISYMHIYLETVTIIGEGSIKDGAFSSCTSLINVTIDNNVTSIDNQAFFNCRSLASVTIGNGVTSIGSQAFAWCCNLTSIEIPDSVTNIGNYAFSNCYKLVEVINKSPHITITKSSSSNGCVGYYALSVYNSDSGITESQLINDNGYIIRTEGYEKVLIGYAGSSTELTIPNYVTKIYEYAFYYSNSLKSITITSNVKSIGDNAFYYCKELSSIIIGNGVTSIGSCAFYKCSRYLRSIRIPNGVKSIGDYAFNDCEGLRTVTIGNGVTSIGKGAFSDCDSLTSVTLSDTSTWYRTTSFSDFKNKTNGIYTNLTDASTNVTYFITGYYFYKS